MRNMFLLICLQDPEGGGIADRPGDMVDVFHTLFGIAGESFFRCGVTAVKSGVISLVCV